MLLLGYALFKKVKVGGVSLDIFRFHHLPEHPLEHSRVFISPPSD
jgi:hypothetical protein